ncbi:MAG: hypothetical protein GF311_00705 [Candidatus Lokiarchaeota archaeon]|nr:hypothetical protein [Candidatus Lokiarchaeota archaeon]
MVGDIISPGNLTKNLIRDLTKDVIKYLTEYNAMLRDYTGSELYAVEFELINFNEKAASTRIYPKSMMLVPGTYKECESLMLALKPETGYLNVHKSSQSINDISKLFFEVEEYANHPDLDTNETTHVYNLFAQRFSKKLYGELLEEKWNKKLIGLSESLPTDKEQLDTYSKLKSRIEINLHKKPLELNFTEIDFDKIKNPFEGKTALEHLKFSITEPSAGFVAEKTLKLGSNLLNLANFGTIDEFQDKLTFYILNKLKNIKLITQDNWEENKIISLVGKHIEGIKTQFEKLNASCQDFLTSGVKGNLDEILIKLKDFLEESLQNDDIDLKEIYQILKNFIKRIITEKANIRANFLESSFNYFSELIKRSFETILNNLPQYLLNIRLKNLIQRLALNLKQKFEKEEKPVRLLGNKFIDELKEYLLRTIKIYSLFPKNEIKFDKHIIQKNFSRLIINHLDDFFKNVNLGIKEIISFAEINLKEGLNQINSHISNFKKFSGEIHFLLSYILRYSTINRFLKDIPDKEISDPVSFSTKFHRFLEKRLAGINLEWKSLILDWIKDYAKLFFKLDMNRNWTLFEIYTDFINYLEEKEIKARDTDNFVSFLDTFISNIDDREEKHNLIRLYEQYKYFSGIKTEFPKYLRKKIEEEISTFNIEWETGYKFILISPDNNENSYYEYLKENELKYFSDLIPIPSSLILRHQFTHEELDLFKGDLFQVFTFKYWGEGNIAFNLSDNFKKVYREWIKEL